MEGVRKVVSSSSVSALAVCLVDRVGVGGVLNGGLGVVHGPHAIKACMCKHGQAASTESESFILTPHSCSLCPCTH